MATISIGISKEYISIGMLECGFMRRPKAKSWDLMLKLDNIIHWGGS